MTDPAAQTGSVMTCGEYLAVSYDPLKVPFGPYPGRLARYLHERYLGGPGRLLDAGCGRGEFLSAFKALGYDVAGVDISPKAPDFAPEFPVAVTALGIGNLPYAADSFDYAFSESVVEHLRDPDAFLAGIFREIRPGGRAIIMTPSWMHNAWGPFYIDHTHVTPFTAPSLAQAMELAGFVNVGCTHFYQLPSVWRFPAVKVLCGLIAMTPLPYRTFRKAPWPDGLNKFIRFSNEVMLLAVGDKPEAGKK
jgi:SAM-dependent methyltransferase